MVNPTARQRRGVSTDEAYAALLPNYRLSFSYGGAANIAKKTGFEVYGIVMKCSSVKDWEVLKDFDAGYNCVDVDVFPLKQKDGDCEQGSADNESIPEEEEEEEEEGFARVQDKPIRAHVFVLPQDKLNIADRKKLPQERYLRVIASGMETYGVDQEYINDEIMGVEFIPSRKPEDYLQFPPADPNNQELPSLSMSAWNKECQRWLNQAKKKNSKSNLSLFRIGEHAIQVRDASPENPFCVWLKERLEGSQDSTWVIVQTLFDPDLPLIANPEQVTPIHQAWAENQMMEKFQQAGVEGTTIYQVQSTARSSSPSMPPKRPSMWLQAAMQQSFRSLRSQQSNQFIPQRQSTGGVEPLPNSSPPADRPIMLQSKVRSIRSHFPSLRSSTTTSHSANSKAPLRIDQEPVSAICPEYPQATPSVHALHGHGSSELGLCQNSKSLFGTCE